MPEKPSEEEQTGRLQALTSDSVGGGYCNTDQQQAQHSAFTMWPPIQGVSKLLPQ